MSTSFQDTVVSIIVFAPKYRRKEIYGQLKKDIGNTADLVQAKKNIKILEAEACIDHIHMLVGIRRT